MAKSRITKQRIIEEIIACGKDPIYFINKYARIQHPVRGLIPFKTYDYQNDVIEAYLNNRFNIVLKARQLGLTTITAAYVAWLILFHRDKNVLIVATKQETAKNSIRIIRNVLKYTPKWLRDIAPVDVNNRHSMELENGSRVLAVATSTDVGRSYSPSFMVVDEAAHIPQLEEIWVGLGPAISEGGSVALLSTPNGTANFFHTTYVQAKNKENNFNCELGQYTNPEDSGETYSDRLMWWVHPTHDQLWFDNETRGKSPREVAQEFLCFGKDTKVFTDIGYRNIQDLSVGDKVLTHKGRFKKIVQTNNRPAADAYRFKTFLNRFETVVTGEHPILSDTEGWKKAGDIKEKDLVCAVPKFIEERNSNKLQVVDLCEVVQPKYFKLIQEGDYKVYVNDRRFKTRHNRYVPIARKFGYLAGIYAAEGYMSKSSVNLSFNFPEELDTWVSDVVDIVEDLFGLDGNMQIYNQGKSGTLMINSEIVKQLLGRVVDGNTAHEKALSDFGYQVSNKEFFMGFVDGVFDGDGCIKDIYDKTLSLTSDALIYDVKYALSSLGLSRLSIRKGVEAKISTIMGREVQTRSQNVLKVLQTRGVKIKRITDLLYLDYINENVSHKKSHNENENFTLSSVICKEKISEPTIVYNIEVEDDHSFVTEHFVSHNCNFNASGDTFIYHTDIAKMARRVREPEKTFHSDRNVWIWEEPQSGGMYLIPADVSRGDAADYSAFHVLRIDCAPLRQVAEYKGKIRPDYLGGLLMQVSAYYNNATVAPENNSGWSGQTILKMEEANFPHIHYSKRSKPRTKDNWAADPYYAAIRNDYLPGYSVTSANRLPMLAKLEEYIRMDNIEINSPRLLEEIKTFIVKVTDRGERPEAQRGYNDDLVMALAGGLYVREEAYIWSYRSDEMTKAMLDGMSSSRTPASAVKDLTHSTNPYDRARVEQYVQEQNKMVMANGDEIDLNWLLTSG